MQHRRLIAGPLAVFATVALLVPGCTEVTDPSLLASAEPCATEGAVEFCFPGPPTMRGVGACADGTRVCSAGQWGPCEGFTLPTEESCDDDVDNDCNGVRDEGCACAAGSSRDCYAGPSSARGIGNCVLGTQSCTDGAWSDDCAGDVLPTIEACNEQDDDCNGILDDGCACVSGQSRDCYTGPPETREMPPCRGGTQYCSAGQWDTTCTGEVTPTPELCNGIDDDCDGSADEELGTTSCGTGPCTNTVASCVDGEPQDCEPLCDGVNCTDGAECPTGYCKDGRCCNSACTSPCLVCSTGTCTPVTSGFDSPECMGSNSCDAAGSCKKVNGQSCASASDCVSGYCKDGRCCNSSCDTACRSCATGSCSVVTSANDNPECTGAYTCDASGTCRSTSPIYTNSFESGGDVSSLTVWHNCAADGSWSVDRAPYPAPGGGANNLRFHTTAFESSCSYPGAYAITPAISVTPGRTYRAEAWSRVASNYGGTHILFFDSGGQDVGPSAYAAWPNDAWQYKSNPSVAGVAPANATTLRVRLEMNTASEYADLDLLAVYEDP